MLRVPISEVVPGMSLAIPVLHPERANCILLNQDYVLDEKTIERLGELKLRDLWISYPGLEQIGQYINPVVLRARSELTETVGKVIETFLEGADRRVDWRDYHKTMNGLAGELIGDPTAAVFVDELSHNDPQQLRHASTVCFLSALLGLKLQGYLVQQRRRLLPRHAANVINLGIGAMLHDIGMHHLPGAVLERWAETRDESDTIWQHHAKLGHEMVTGQIEPSAAAIVLHHHQYFDGTGFPTRPNWEGVEQGLDGELIHIFARIVTLADQFDELRNPPQGRTRPVALALQALISAPMSSRFDPIVLRALLEIVPAYAPGSQVVLSDGRKGYVAGWQPDRPCRPSVALVSDPGRRATGPVPIVHLSRRHDLEVAMCDGVDVSDVHFAIPSSLRPRRWARALDRDLLGAA